MKKFMENKSKIIPVVLFSMLVIGSALPSVYAEDNKQDFEQIGYFDICDGTISVAIPIGAYEIKNTEQGQEVSVKNLGCLLVPGKPSLPSKIFSVAIPPGAEVRDVMFDIGEGVTLPRIYKIPPTPLPRVIGQEKPLIYEREKKTYEENYDAVYGCDESYPESVGELVCKANYRKYSLVDVRITPFNYYPVSGRLVYFPKVTVNVQYTFPEGFSFDDIMIDNLESTERTAEK